MNKHRYDRLIINPDNYNKVEIGDVIFVNDINEFEHCLQNKQLQRKIVFKGINKLLNDNFNKFTIFSIFAQYENKELEIIMTTESAILTLESDLADSLDKEDYDNCIIIRDLLIKLNQKEKIKQENKLETIKTDKI